MMMVIMVVSNSDGDNGESDSGYDDGDSGGDND